MAIRIASWNINSVRLRLPLIEQYTRQASPDILCLQETKTVDATFPLEALQALGYPHILYSGEKSYNGVAILSKLPLAPLPEMDMTGDNAKRHIAARVDDKLMLHNFYIPAGGDVPDAALNPKFANKLAFLSALESWSSGIVNDSVIAVGDFNIAPFEHDVWSHKQLRSVVSHTDIEITRLQRIQRAGNWIDTGRHFTPESEKLYSWWSYRNRDWRKSNRGRRLDHIWVTQVLRPSLKAYDTLTTARDWERPSDHVPIMLTLDI